MESEQVKASPAEAPATDNTPNEVQKEPVQLSQEALDKKIEELVEQRLKEREGDYRKKIEDAQRLLDEAEEREALEARMLESEKYSSIKTWTEQKENEFKREMARLGEMGRRRMHMANMYENYDLYQAQAARGDQRAKDMLGRIQLIDACMRYTPDQLLQIYKRNIGVIDF